MISANHRLHVAAMAGQVKKNAPHRRDYLFYMILKIGKDVDTAGIVDDPNSCIAFA